MSNQTDRQSLWDLLRSCCPCRPHDFPNVKVNMLVAGVTVQTHETFMEKLKLQIELCSAESSNAILVFCPVVSRIGTDMEAAMAKVTENKPVILVFMHHCHNPSHMTNIGVQPSRGNIVQVVHCAYHETKGLLECQENEQAVAEVRSALLRCVDSQVEVIQSKVPHTQSEEEQPLLASQDSSSPNIINDNKLHRKGTDPAPAMEHSTGSSGDHTPEVKQSDVICTKLEIDQQLMAPQDVNKTNTTNDSELPGKGTEAAGDESKSDERENPTGDHTPEVKQSDVICTELETDQQLMAPQDVNKTNTTNDSELPRKGTEAAGDESKSDERENPTGDHTPEVKQSDVICTELETDQQLMAPQDFNKTNATNDSELPGKGTEAAGDESKTDERENPTGDHTPEVKQSNVICTELETDQQLMAPQDVNKTNTTNDSELPRKGTEAAGDESKSDERENPTGDHTPEVKQSDVICTELETDQQLMAPQDFNKTNTTNDSELPGKGTEAAGDESKTDERENPTGDHTPEVKQSDVICTELETDQQLMAPQDVNKTNTTNDSELPRKGTEAAGDESKSDERENPTGDPAPKVQSSNALCTNLDMEVMASQNANSLNIAIEHELLRKGFDPAGEESEPGERMIVSAMEPSTGPTGVKVHMLVAGETFKAHDTFMQKLKLQIELCSAESSNVILVFCPVVSQIGTDMEAAMARVTEDKPVILLFMHHCHNPSHMTDITVHPSRGNIVQVVHCAFYENKGLLECQENEQAVTEVQAMLKKHK